MADAPITREQADRELRVAAMAVEGLRVEVERLQQENKLLREVMDMSQLLVERRENADLRALLVSAKDVIDSMCGPRTTLAQRIADKLSPTFSEPGMHGMDTPLSRQPEDASLSPSRDPQCIYGPCSVHGGCAGRCVCARDE